MRDPDGIRADLRSGRRRAADARPPASGACVLTCADRYLAGRLAEHHLGATIHVLDDGFQHLQLDRDIDLLIVARDDLARPADASGRTAARAARHDDRRRCHPGGRRRRRGRTGGGVAAGVPDSANAAAAPSRRPAGARDCGHRRTARVSSTICEPRAGRWRRPCRSAITTRIRPATCGGSCERAVRCGAARIVTTEKDAVRLLQFRPFAVPLVAVPLRVEPQPAREFRAWLADAIAPRVTSMAEQPTFQHRARVRRRPRRGRRGQTAADARSCSPPGRLLGRAFYVFDGAHRRLAMSNLVAAFPLRSRAECRAIARGMFSHFGRLLMVLLKFSTMTPERMLAQVEFEGEERVAAAHAQGKGVLLFTGHFGFWEINALVHALAMQPMAVLARPLDNPLLHDLLESVRRSTGNSVIYRRGAIRRVLRALSANQAVAILIDQHIQTSDAVYVDFFNRPAATTSALAALALRTGAPVVPVFALPLPGGTVPDGLRTPRRSACAPTIPTRFASSPSAAPTCSRCTCAATRTCGSGCTAGGATSRRRSANVPGMFPAAQQRGRRCSAARLRSRSDRTGRRSRAELAGRRGDGAAGDGGRPPDLSAIDGGRRGARHGRAAVRGDHRRRARRSAHRRGQRRRARSCRAGRFDLAILLPNSFRSAWVGAACRYSAPVGRSSERTRACC